jgi:hypothetical protein
MTIVDARANLTASRELWPGFAPICMKPTAAMANFCQTPGSKLLSR